MPTSKKKNKSLHLLFITRAYAPNAGGMERLSWELIHELSSDPKVNATIIAPNSVDTSRAARMFQTAIFLIVSIPRALVAARKADVVHLGDPALSFLGWLIKKIYKKPVAVTVHSLDVTYSNPLYQFYLKLFFRKFDLYLPISTYASKLLEYRVSDIKYQIVTPGFHDTWYDPTLNRNDLMSLPLIRGIKGVSVRRILLTSGRLVKRKGHEWFIRNVLPKLSQQTLYLIAGEGPERHAIERAVAQTRQYEKVLLLGRVSDETLKTLYNTIDAFIQPNIKVEGDVEGFGIVLLEAASCARPVYAANLEGIPDAIHDRKNGTLLPSQNTDAWLTALKNISKPKPAMRDYTLKEFSWRHQAEQYFQAFQSMLTNQDN